MKQATYNRDKQAWKRWPWNEIAFAAVIGGTMLMVLLLAPAGWWV
jgi:Mg/Co/Ni transporter MgtE